MAAKPIECYHKPSWVRTAWSGLGRGKNWITRRFEEDDDYPIWTARMMEITADLQESFYVSDINARAVLGEPRETMYEWQPNR